MKKNKYTLHLFHIGYTKRKKTKN